MMNSDDYYMKLALDMANSCKSSDDVPVGAVIVDGNGDVISAGNNERELNNISTHHAEIVAIEKACKRLNSWRLSNCTLYVTLEPCPMCAGAIINSRIKRVVYGTFDQKGGACGSVINLFAMDFNHRPSITYGVLQNECSEILTDFFKNK